MFRKIKIRIGLLISAISFLVLFIVTSALSGVTYFSSITSITNKLDVTENLVAQRKVMDSFQNGNSTTATSLNSSVEETTDSTQSGDSTTTGDSTSSNETPQFPDDNRGRLFPELDYFYFKMGNDEEVLETVFGNESIDQERAQMYAREAFLRTNTFGQIEVTYYKKTVTDTYTELYFVDATTEINNRKNVLYHSLVIGVSSFVLLTGLGFALSSVIVRPYEKLYLNEKTFLTNASHELKTPLAIMNLNTELLKKKHPEDEENQVLEDQIHRMGTLVNELVTLNKVNELTTAIPKESTDLTELIYECLDQFVPIYESRGIKVETNIAEGINVMLNQESIYKLMSILLENASKYTNDNGRIEISLKEEKKFCRLLIRNSTNGISQVNIKHVFDRFYTMDESHSAQSSGYGIGLSIAKKIVEINLASITAYADTDNYFNILISFKSEKK